MNPAALKTNLPTCRGRARSSSNTDEFNDANLKKAGYEANPLEDGALAGYRVIEVPITSMNARALKDSGLNTKQIDRSKNFFALGLMFWLYERSAGDDAELDRREVREEPGGREGERRHAEGRLQLRRDDGALPGALPRAEGAADARPLPQHHRQRGDGARLPHGRAARRAAAVLRQLPDHAGQRHPARARALQALRREDVPGGGRDRRHRLGDRRRFGGSLGLTGTSGPGLALKSEASGSP